jgi:hypothetical protein
MALEVAGITGEMNQEFLLRDIPEIRSQFP